MSSSVVSEVDLEAPQVAVVDADHVDVELERDLEILLVVDLDERVEIEGLRLVVEVRQLIRIERGDDQQDGVGAEDRRFEELVGVDDEVLAKDRQA